MDMIKYKDVIDLGFKRNELGCDSVFFDENGYDWFICEKKLTNLKKGYKLMANWHPEDKSVEIIKLNNQDLIEYRLSITERSELIKIIKLF